MRTLTGKRSWALVIAAVLGAIGATVVVLVIITSTKTPATPASHLATFPGVGFVSVDCPDCEGHDDIRAGAQVVIVDGSKNVLATGVLGRRGSDGYVDNVYPFRTGNIPIGKGMYGVVVGNQAVVWADEREVEDHGFAVRVGS